MQEQVQNAVAVSEKFRAVWRLLGKEDAPSMPHRQSAGQSFQGFNSLPGIDWTCRAQHFLRRRF